MRIYEKALFISLIGISLIASSVFASHIPVLWLPFVISILIMAGAVTGLRLRTREEVKTSASEKNPLTKFVRLLKEEEKEVGLLLNEKTESAEWSERLEIDQQHFYTEIEEVRAGLVDVLGMKNYISVITTFAAAERQLNRALSAAIDTYYDEADKALTKGREQLLLTLQIIEQTGMAQN